jgi:hypothetical protein
MSTLPLPEEDDLHQILAFGLQSAFWERYLHPLLVEKGKQVLTSLASSHAADDDIKRGWYQAIQFILSAPVEEMARFRMETEVAQQRASDDEAENFRADFGRNSPFTTSVE